MPRFGNRCLWAKITVVEEEEEKEIKEKIVHQDLKCEDEEFKPGKPVEYKNKLWVVKEIKVNGVIEIEAPYSRRVKKVDKKLLKMSWCDGSKRNTNIKVWDFWGAAAIVHRSPKFSQALCASFERFDFHSSMASSSSKRIKTSVSKTDRGQKRKKQIYSNKFLSHMHERIF
ncbi:hypothetical protein LR48_Vigan07g117700 [Vigna angularis]|uniref:Uncharacterized protein n=1 Tax=Phaseolus angularis TaxID=3914 RepID=A0A0L9UXJ5_PHAAN|nr:hypothetical protein LR48_Vigan07g117700 [Vigna angularis]